MFARQVRLFFALQLMLPLQIALLGFKIRARETVAAALLRYNFRTGLLAGAVDLDDDDVKAAINAAVEEALAPLKAKNKELLGKLNKAKAGAEIDPADIERLEGEVETLKTQLADANKALKTATKEAETAKGALATEQAAVQKLVVETGLRDALTANGVTDPAFQKAALALLRSGQKIDLVADGENRVAKIGDKALGDFVKEWSQGDEGKAFVSAPNNSGGGGHGSGNKAPAANPWTKGSENLTEQGRIYKENPTLARSMAAEHGVTII